MTVKRLAATAFAGMAMLAASAALAADYPARPIKVIVGYAAGGGADIMARYYAAEIEKLAGQPVIVENRVGANGQIVTEAAIKSAPDGHTLLMHGTTSVFGNIFLMKSATYDPVASLEPVATLFQNPFVLSVNPNRNIETVADLTAHLKAKGGRGSYGVPTGGGLISAAQYMLIAGVPATRVNYKSSTDAVRDIVGGDLDFVFTDAPFSIAQAKQGRVKLLAVTSRQRAEMAADLVTMEEAGVPGFEFTARWGLWFPKGTPGAIVEKMHAWVETINAKPETLEFIARNGAMRWASPTLEDARKTMAADFEYWREIATAAKIEKQ